MFIMPFYLEEAKSNRSVDALTRKVIPKGELRLIVMRSTFNMETGLDI